MGWPAARNGSSGVPSCPPQVRCSSPPPLSTAALGSQMLPPALVLQNQCLLPRELSQCPTPVLPLPHAEQSPGTTPAKHRVPTCFPQAPWSFTVPCRLHALLSPPLTLLGRDEGPQPLQVLHGAPAVTGTEASTDPAPRKVRPCTFLLPQGLSPHPSQLCPSSCQLLHLAWDPQVQPHTRLGQLQHCVTCSITPFRTRSTIADAFSHSELFPEASSVNAGVVSVGLCSPAPGWVCQSTRCVRVFYTLVCSCK